MRNIASEINNGVAYNDIGEVWGRREYFTAPERSKLTELYINRRGESTSISGNKSRDHIPNPIRKFFL